MEHDLSPALSEGERCRLLLNSITDYAIYMLDATGRVSSWNRGAERFKGYESSEILGEHFSRFYSEEDRAAGAPERALATARNEGRFEGEGWRIRKDAGRFWAHVVIDPILSPTGTVIGYAKITRDLTEKKEANDLFLRNQEQFRVLVQGVVDYAIYMLDLSGRVTSWNAGAQRIKGYEQGDILGKHFSRFYTPEDRADGLPKRALETAAREGRFESEGWRVRKDGTRFWASVVIDPIQDDGGNLIGYAKVTRDVTGKRDAQQALERAQDELLQSRKMEALGRLAGGVAHDFNNLLMAISGSLELLRKRVPGDPKLAALLDNAMQGAQRGASLTERLLAFSRNQPLNPQRADLPGLVQGFRDLLQLSLGGGIELVMRDWPPVSAVHVDANQLELGLLNLVANARDAMPSGGTLTVSISEVAIPALHETGLSPGRYVCLSVSDTGDGMDEATLARAAEPFFTTKGPGKGTGLGLSVVHSFLEESRGRLLVKSRKGSGTTVEMLFPALEGEFARCRQAEDSESHEDRQEALMVLAVDDDALVLLNTVAMLEDLGHTALEASSGAEALLQLEKHAVDLVITDQGMPGMTGLQLARAINERSPGTPVVMATGYLNLPDQAAASALPQLRKPFGLEELRSVIGEAVAPGLAARRPLPEM